MNIHYPVSLIIFALFGISSWGLKVLYRDTPRMNKVVNKYMVILAISFLLKVVFWSSPATDVLLVSMAIAGIAIAAPWLVRSGSQIIRELMIENPQPPKRFSK